MEKRSYTPIWFYGFAITSFAVFVISLVMQWQGWLEWMLACGCLQLSFAVAAINEIRKSVILSLKEKRNWYGLLLACPLITGFFYLQRANSSPARS